MSDTPHRLPVGVRPHRYELCLAPDLEAARFRGRVTISVLVDEPTDRVVLHALELDITSAAVTSLADPDATPGADPLWATVHLDGATETATLQLDRVLPAGAARLDLEFTGALNDQLVGLYRSTFRTGEGDDEVEHTLAVTQFESTHARRAFPCFDEPALKAVFSITLEVPPTAFVVANTAEVDRRPTDDGRVRVHFADTIPMSTYLVAFVVGPLEATVTRVVDGIDGPIPLRVVHPPGQGHLCGFALDVAEAALRFFERYYELPYPGDKVDLVAVPDFAFGAMENLGCITFREVLLLVDPDDATQPELQRVADVINHELAHMWFGDLVTMRWWNGIWLNEAFATFMEVKASASFRPEWDVWTTFGLARAAAFDTDTLRTTRPIEYEVVTAADAEGMFDILTYEKGASVVRMLEQYLGEEPFRSGIVEYLRRHAYSTTETTDLWDALEQVTGEPVRRIMDRWIFHGGHPVVQVRRTGDGLSLDQVRAGFGPAPDTGGTATADHGGTDRAPNADGGTDDRWPIPMVLALGDGADRTRRLLLEQPTVVRTDGPPSFVQANVGGAGFYRVELDHELRMALLRDGAPGALERFVLLDDTWSALLADRVSLAEAAALVEQLAPDEQDPSVWRRLAAACRDVARLAGPSWRSGTAPWIAGLAAPALARTEAALADHDAPEHERLREVRGVLFGLAGAHGADDQVRARARSLLDDHRADASLRAAALTVVASSATAAEHTDLERRWRAAATPQEELRHLYALVDTDLADDFLRAVELAVTQVRAQNAPYLLRRALEHPTLGWRAWQVISDRWHELGARFPSNSLPRMLEGIRGVTEPELAGRIREFLAAHPTPSGAQQVDQHLERMGVTVQAAQRARAELERSPGMLGNGPS